MIPVAVFTSGVKTLSRYKVKVSVVVELSVNVKAVATTHGTLDTEATNVGTTDLEVLADFTGANGNGTAGVATVTVLYVQNNNLS